MVTCDSWSSVSSSWAVALGHAAITAEGVSLWILPCLFLTRTSVLFEVAIAPGTIYLRNCFWNTISSFVTRTFFVTSWQSPDSSVSSSSWLSSNPSICHRDAPEESSIRAAVFIIVERLTWHIWRNLDSELSMRRFGFTRSRRKVTCTVIGSWRRWVICKEVMLDKSWEQHDELRVITR